MTQMYVDLHRFTPDSPKPKP